MTTPADYSQRLSALAEPMAIEHGFLFESLSIRKAGRRLLVQIILDSDGLFDLDEAARFSRKLDELIEAQDLFNDEAYTLEVTSPGIDRPLTLPRHWRKNVGRLVVVVRDDGSEFTDRVVAADETSVTFEKLGAVEIAALSQGLVQIEFNRKGPASDAADDTDEDAAFEDFDDAADDEEDEDN